MVTSCFTMAELGQNESSNCIAFGGGGLIFFAKKCTPKVLPESFGISLQNKPEEFTDGSRVPSG